MRAVRWIVDLFRSGQRVLSAPTGWPWFRAGYYAAVKDIKDGVPWPMTDHEKEAAVNRHMNRWIDSGR